MSKKDVKIMVVTHKNSPMPADNDLYVPTLVGPQKDNLTFSNSYRDDVGENISEKNSSYCELTALYWAWKNLDVDYIGLVHYRRFFMDTTNRNKILSSDTLNALLEKHDVILPKKRNYFIETTYSHYAHNHNISDLLVLREIISENSPSYLEAFDQTMRFKKSHRFNMLIMKKELLNDYCEWLFEILDKLELVIDVTEYDQYQSRIYGFLAERMLDVWIIANKIEYSEVPFKFSEKQNWLKKGRKFLFNKIGFNKAGFTNS